MQTIPRGDAGEPLGLGEPLEVGSGEAAGDHSLDQPDVFGIVLDDEDSPIFKHFFCMPTSH